MRMDLKSLKKTSSKVYIHKPTTGISQEKVRTRSVLVGSTQRHMDMPQPPGVLFFIV
jgi:hypothetical protein